MIEKVVKVKDLSDKSLQREDLYYWLSRPPEDRIAAVEYLRRQFDGSAARLQRIAKVIERSRS
jgi:hypothetical protein